MKNLVRLIHQAFFHMTYHSLELTFHLLCARLGYGLPPLLNMVDYLFLHTFATTRPSPNGRLYVRRLHRSFNHRCEMPIDILLRLRYVILFTGCKVLEDVLVHGNLMR